MILRLMVDYQARTAAALLHWAFVEWLNRPARQAHTSLELGRGTVYVTLERMRAKALVVRKTRRRQGVPRTEWYPSAMGRRAWIALELASMHMRPKGR